MKILALDTSSVTCSVAITENKTEISELHSGDEKTHSVKLMPMIDNIFKDTALSLDDIDLLACCIGPGSFTGVRIGIATTKAFCDVKKIPSVGVSSLEGLAYNIINSCSNNDLICSIIDAKNNNVYCGCFNVIDSKLEQISELMAESIDETLIKINDIILNGYDKIIFVGDASELYKDMLERNITCKNIDFASSDKHIACSTSIAIAAYNKYLNNEFGDSNSIHPLYLRKSQAERALDEKNN